MDSKVFTLEFFYSSSLSFPLFHLSLDMTDPHKCQEIFDEWIDLVHRKVLDNDAAFLWSNKTDPTYIHDVEVHHKVKVKGGRWTLHYWLHAYTRPGGVDPRETTFSENDVHSSLIVNISDMSDWPLEYIDGSKKVTPTDGKFFALITSWKYSSSRSIELFTVLDDKTKTSTEPLVTAKDVWESSKSKARQVTEEGKNKE
jgi:hypothetical protein